MSIRTFNKIMSAKGCIPVVSLVLLVTMIMSFSGRGCGNPRQGADQAADATTIATVGSYAISEQTIQTEYEDAVGKLGTPPKAKDEASYYGIFLSQEVNAGLALIEAKQKGVPIGDADLRADLNQAIEATIEGERANLMRSGQLKGFSDKDFDAAFQTVSGGKTVAQYRKQLQDALAESLKDPAKRASAAARYAATQVPKVLASRLKPTDDELKDSFKSLMVKQVLLNGSDVSGQIAQVQADLKHGSTFEDVINRYSKDKAAVGKKLSEVEAPITSDQLLDESYAPLRTLKAGQISPVIITPAGSVIYKVEQVKANLPKDFDKNKDLLRTKLAQQLADTEFQKDLKELAQSVAIAWKDAGWHALYDYYQASTDFTATADAKTTKLKAVADESQKAGHSQPAALAFYASVEDMTTAAPGKPTADLQNLLVEAIQAVSEYAPGSDLDLELAGIFASKKDGANLGQALVKASQDNSDLSAAGQAVYVQVQSMTLRYGSLLTTTAKQDLAAAQAAWQNSNDERKKEEASAAKAKADMDKQAAEDKKKFEAEKKAAAKAALQAPVAGPPAPKASPAAKP